MWKEKRAQGAGYEFVFDKKDVRMHDNFRWFQIILNGQAFELPMVNVGTTDSAAIAYLNTNPDVNRDLAVAAAYTYRDLLQKVKSRAVVYLTSEKSEWSIHTGAQLAGVNIICKLPGGKDKEKAIADSLDGKVIEYTPVTGKLSYVGLPKNFYETINQLRNDGVTTMDIVDDVRTTGASIDAAREILAAALPDMKFRYVVLAQETKYKSGTYPLVMANSPDGIAYCSIPEFVDMYQASELVPISAKETGGIPQALTVSVN